MVPVMKAAGSTWWLVAVCLLLTAVCTSVAVAETFTVTKTEDDNGPCTLDDCAMREAVIAANAAPGADRIVLSAGVYTLTIDIPGDDTAGDLNIRDDLEIVGDPSGKTVLEAQFANHRVMAISFSDVTISDVELTGGHLLSGVNSSFGGCVRMLVSDVTFLNSSITNCYCRFEGGGVAVQHANITFINSTLSGNESETLGGAIYHAGLEPEHGLTLINTTVSGNIAGIRGGGIFRTNDGEALISHATIAFNEAPIGDALYLGFPTRRTWVQNSIIEGKCKGISLQTRGGNLGGPDLGDHCFKFSDLASDLGAEDLGLAPLAIHHGLTQSHSLDPHSPAINTANPAYCESTDQRGIPRPQGTGCDIGAVEAASTAPPEVPVLGPWGLPALVLLLGSAGLRLLRRR